LTLHSRITNGLQLLLAKARESLGRQKVGTAARCTWLKHFRHFSRGGPSNAWRFDSATTPRHIFFKALTKRGFLPVSRSIRSSEASWRKCHKTAKNVRAGLDSNLPSRRNAYKQISELSSGGFLSNHRRGFAERCREANSKREFGLGNLFREGGDGHVWGTDKNIQPHRHRIRTWHDARGFRYELASRQSCGFGRRLLRGSRGAGAELEATTVRKGNKKVSVTLSGWVVKYGDWWDDGVETN